VPSTFNGACDRAAREIVSMPKKSAGVLIWKRVGKTLQVLLVHPGGPFWRNTDAGAWSLPKGEYDEAEDALAAARRELLEELGPSAATAASGADDAFLALGEVKQKGGKIVTAFAREADFDVSQLASNTFEIEWPPKSGKRQAFAEVDRAAWFTLDQARHKILPGQLELLARADKLLAGDAARSRKE
jgi:predicted NUDIX family NTP pyrophosphohydrolase